MNVSGYKSTWVQGLLWEEPLRGHGHVRYVIGDLAERITVRRFGGRRCKTDSRVDYCPDIIWNWQYLECKAVGRSRQAFVYAGRLAKDRAFAASGRDLVYVVWHHRAETKTAGTVQQLERLVVANLQALYVAPFAVIDAICSRCVEEPLNSAYGRYGTDKCYGSGFRFSVDELRDHQVELMLEDFSCPSC